MVKTEREARVEGRMMKTTIRICLNHCPDMGPIRLHWMTGLPGSVTFPVVIGASYQNHLNIGNTVESICARIPLDVYTLKRGLDSMQGIEEPV